MIPIEAIEDIPIKVNPTLQVLIPPLAPNNLAKIVGNKTKCAPSRLNEMHTSNKNNPFFKSEFFIYIISGNVNPIIT